MGGFFSNQTEKAQHAAPLQSHMLPSRGAARRGGSHYKCSGLVFGPVFFERRRGDTRFKCDWGSDVCSSDLGKAQPGWPERYAARSIDMNQSATAAGATRKEKRTLRSAKSAASTVPASIQIQLERMYGKKDRKSVV